MSLLYPDISTPVLILNNLDEVESLALFLKVICNLGVSLKKSRKTLSYFPYFFFYPSGVATDSENSAYFINSRLLIAYFFCLFLSKTCHGDPRWLYVVV